jgi:hypothetical protein
MLCMIRYFLVALTISAALAGASPALAIEEPNHTVTASEERFEIRTYPALIAAEVRVSGSREQAANEAFRILANYIFGANRTRGQIAMTAPVTQARNGEKIAMTAPVTQTEADGGDWQVQFFMPREWTMDTLPTPNDARITLSTLPGRTLAVVRFSGFATQGALASNEERLRTWLVRRGTPATGTATYAFYDPPWTLPFLRRNEVMLEIAP